MKFFGIEIKRVKKNEASKELSVVIDREEVPVVFKKAKTVFTREPEPERTGALALISGHKAIHPLTAAIQWPIPEHLNPYQETLYRNAIGSFNSFLINCNKYDCTGVDKVLKIFPVLHDRKASEYLEILRSLHCIAFGDMHPAIVNKLPEMINYVLNGGRVISFE